jgi:hypothetical protein
MASAAAAAAATGSGDLEDDGRTLLHCVCMLGTTLSSSRLHFPSNYVFEQFVNPKSPGDANALVELLSAGANPHPAPPRTPDPVGAAAGLGKKAVKKKR